MTTSKKDYNNLRWRLFRNLNNRLRLRILLRKKERHLMPMAMVSSGRNRRYLRKYHSKILTICHLTANKSMVIKASTKMIFHFRGRASQNLWIILTTWNLQEQALNLEEKTSSQKYNGILEPQSKSLKISNLMILRYQLYNNQHTREWWRNSVPLL